MANHSIDEVNDLIITITLPHDDWDEPTDGTILLSKKNKKDYMYNFDGTKIINHQYGTGENYWNHKYGKYLKPKNRKHYKLV